VSISRIAVGILGISTTGFGVWKEDLLHCFYAEQEALLKEEERIARENLLGQFEKRINK
jgi:hypothetical protein